MRRATFFPVFAVALCVGIAKADESGSSLADAVDLSKKTGAPILAVAGNET